MNSEYSEAISETLEVLKYMEEDLLNKIPLDVIKNLKSKKSENYINKFDNEAEVDFSKVSNKTKDILAVLYREYIADDQEKIEFDKMINENELKISTQDYTIKKFEKAEMSPTNLVPVQEKKNFIQRMLERIFRI